jgi:hypothetical protein
MYHALERVKKLRYAANKVCLPHMIIFPYSNNRLIFVIRTRHVYCEVGTNLELLFTLISQ